MKDLSQKTIITVAPTGSWPTKKDNPNIPLTPAEIASEVVECWKAGAAVAHLHMRDDEEQGTMDKNRFAETVHIIRNECDIVLNLTTSGALDATDETRMAHLIELKPELASYDAGSMNWMHTTLFINSPQFLEKLGQTTQENGVKPEIEIFDAGMIYNALYYLKRGVLQAPLHFQFVLGAAGGMAATVENLVFLKGLIPQGSTWSAFGIGRGAVPIMLTAIAMGGHLRVGMEDNIYFSKGNLADSNDQFVRQAAGLIRGANREVATPEEARNILGV